MATSIILKMTQSGKDIPINWMSFLFKRLTIKQYMNQGQCYPENNTKQMWHSIVGGVLDCGRFFFKQTRTSQYIENQNWKGSQSVPSWEVFLIGCSLLLFFFFKHLTITISPTIMIGHCVVVSLCCCVIVSLCCCNVHLTKMCQNGTQEKRESCILLVVIQKEEHPQWHVHLIEAYI